MRKRIYTILESNLPSGLVGRLLNLILITLILVSVLANILASVQGIYTVYREWFFRLELITVTIFSIEYVLRLWSCVESAEPRYHHHPFKGRLRYAL
ncbi:MAG: ion transporter, partial [Gammaproteobacteria bacterium]